MNKKNNRKGFTTVELVIVIAVIAILATVLIPTFSGLINNANDSKYLQASKNAHSYYVSEFDYVNDGTPKTNIVIEYAISDNEKVYFVVNGNQFTSKSYESKDAALAAEFTPATADDYKAVTEIELPESVGDEITFYEVELVTPAQGG